METPSKGGEETLDPAGPEGWAAFRALAHRMVDDMLDHLSSLEQQPAWRPVGPDIRAALNQPGPPAGAGSRGCLPGLPSTSVAVPKRESPSALLGWVQGNGTPLGMMADMLASGLNPHLAGFNHAPALVEHQVLAWLADLMGFPAGSSGPPRDRRPDGQRTRDGGGQVRGPARCGVRCPGARASARGGASQPAETDLLRLRARRTGGLESRWSCSGWGTRRSGACRSTRTTVSILPSLSARWPRIARRGAAVLCYCHGGHGEHRCH